MKEENQSSKLAKMKVNLQKMVKKRWVLPAVYLGLTAVVLSGVFWLQSSDEQITQDDQAYEEEINRTGLGSNDDEDAFPVTATNEVFRKPVLNDEAKVIGQYFDFDATDEQKQAALVFYDNTYYQNKGLDFAMENGEAFDVAAALSGTVVKAEKDALLGGVVHIEHDNQVVTVYQSLDVVDVEEGQAVKQGEVIGQAGRNLYNQAAGIHAHFEVRQNGTPVNPNELFNQPTSALPDPDKQVEAEKQTDDDGLEENKQEVQ